MDWAAILAQEPFSALSGDVREFAQAALSETDIDTLEEASDVLVPFLVDAGLADDEDAAAALCGANLKLPAFAQRAAPMGRPAAVGMRVVPLESQASNPFEEGAPAADAEASQCKAAAAPKRGGREPRPSRAGRASAAKLLAEGSARGAMVLLSPEADSTVRAVAHALRVRNPGLGDEPGEAAGAPYLAASFLAYAVERKPELHQHWCGVLQEVLTDAGASLDDDDDCAAVHRVVQDLIRRQVLVPAEPKIEVGDVVLAELAEDAEWHQAAVEQDLGDNRFRVVFLEYGKPQEASAGDLRKLDMIVDDDGTGDALKEGDCEMCRRALLLTFHHLIPKDTHPTYIKRRLPPGIEGQPTRHFLNSYGLMICRQCHSYVHRLASNEVLAKEYNTLEKILAHPLVGRWVEWASHQRSGKWRT